MFYYRGHFNQNRGFYIRDMYFIATLDSDEMDFDGMDSDGMDFDVMEYRCCAEYSCSSDSEESDSDFCITETLNY